MASEQLFTRDGCLELLFWWQHEHERAFLLALNPVQPNCGDSAERVVAHQGARPVGCDVSAAMFVVIRYTR